MKRQKSHKNKNRKFVDLVQLVRSNFRYHPYNCRRTAGITGINRCRHNDCDFNGQLFDYPSRLSRFWGYSRSTTTQRQCCRCHRARHERWKRPRSPSDQWVTRLPSSLIPPPQHPVTLSSMPASLLAVTAGCSTRQLVSDRRSMHRPQRFAIATASRRTLHSRPSMWVNNLESHLLPGTAQPSRTYGLFNSVSSHQRKSKKSLKSLGRSVRELWRSRANFSNARLKVANERSAITMQRAPMWLTSVKSTIIPIPGNSQRKLAHAMRRKRSLRFRVPVGEHSRPNMKRRSVHTQYDPYAAGSVSTSVNNPTSEGDDNGDGVAHAEGEGGLGICSTTNISLTYGNFANSELSRCSSGLQMSAARSYCLPIMHNASTQSDMLPTRQEVPRNDSSQLAGNESVEEQIVMEVVKGLEDVMYGNVENSKSNIKAERDVRAEAEAEIEAMSVGMELAFELVLAAGADGDTEAEVEAETDADVDADGDGDGDGDDDAETTPNNTDEEAGGDAVGDLETTLNTDEEAGGDGHHNTEIETLIEIEIMVDNDTNSDDDEDEEASTVEVEEE